MFSPPASTRLIRGSTAQPSCVRGEGRGRGEKWERRGGERGDRGTKLNIKSVENTPQEYHSNNVMYHSNCTECIPLVCVEGEKSRENL